MEPATASVESIAAPILLAQFDDLDQQQQASNLGMWVFLATEVMFFGGLIVAYVVYRALSPREFAQASRHLYMWLGFVNTIVLLSSSLAMALAVRSAQLHRSRQILKYLLITMALGTCFLGIKAVEYYREYEERLIPSLNFQLPAEAAGSYLAQPGRFEMFFVLYFFMTGLHAFHLIVGVTLVGVIALLSWRKWLSGSGETQIEVTGLYWHFVDIVWVFLYPLLYLIDVQS
jgi:cytochrome c oxidase subunit 3